MNSSYRYFYLLESGHLIIYSVLEGSCFSTSFFNLLRRKGLRIEWSLVKISWFIGIFFYKAYCMGIENHSIKSAWESKICGIKKCISDHNSPISFCKGVPVSSSRCLVLKFKRTCHLWDLKFLICYASSNII